MAARSVVQREAHNRLVGADGGPAPPARLATLRYATRRDSMIMHQPRSRPPPFAALRSAAPYIRMYKGKTFVVKAGGGDVRRRPAATRASDRADRHPPLTSASRVVFVHGGGPQLTEITEALGVPTRMVAGRRVTDAEGDRRDVDGAERPDQHAAAGALPRD
jgi:hypothetical protein